jgi:hypothetical protein
MLYLKYKTFYLQGLKHAGRYYVLNCKYQLKITYCDLLRYCQSFNVVQRHRRTNAVFGKRVVLFNAKPDATYSNHLSVEGQYYSPICSSLYSLHHIFKIIFCAFLISPMPSTVPLLTRALLQSRYWHTPFYSPATDTHPSTVPLLTCALLQSRYRHAPQNVLNSDLR